MLYEYGNIPRLVQAMHTLMTDHQLRAQMSAEAIWWARQFDRVLSADKMLEVIEGEVSKKHASR